MLLLALGAVSVHAAGGSGSTLVPGVIANSSDASLAGLSVSQGTMTPVFAPGTFAYTDLLAYPVTALTVTSTANESHATITVNGTTVASGAASSPLSLSVGANVISIVVTAQDGTTTQLYTLTVTRAASNNTDYSFGTYGQAVTNAGLSAQARGVVVQPDGKIIAVGNGVVNAGTHVIVARYNGDGSLDATFQATGKVSTDFGGSNEGAQSVALQRDGKIVVAGYTNASGNNQFALARYNPDGSLDTTFNATGKLVPSFGTTSEEAAGVAVQNDGRIIVVGYATAGGYSVMALARFNSDGSPDTTFNVTGQFVTPAGSGNTAGTSVAVQPDGRILIGGYTGPPAGSSTFAVWRFLPDGTPDMAFGVSGDVTTAVGDSSASAAGMALQKDGRIVLAGSAMVNSASTVAVACYNADGSLDTTFNTTGKVTTLVNGSPSVGNSVVVQADGKIVVAGTAGTTGPSDIALVRFNADGSLDTTFNTTGWVTTDLGGLDLGQGLALQRDGKIVVVGQSGLGNYDFAVLRYNSGLIFAPFAWGYNNLGQLGDNNPGATGLTPVAVLLTGALAGKTVVSVAPGIYHTVALCSDGTVACWGSNYGGELGNNTTTPSTIPVPVDTSVNSALHNKTVIAIAAGSSHSLALCSDGTVAAWGAGGYGQLGNTQGTDSLIPVAMYAGAGSAIHNKTVVAMAGGHYHTYLLCSDGTVCGCGFNFDGQIGTGSSSPIFVTYPTAITASPGSALFGKTVVAIATGLYHGLALCSDGSVAGWGRDAEGELGDGTATGSVYTPVAMNMTTGLLAGKTVQGIAAGGLHSLVLCTDGTIAAWGSNSAGQLGNGASGWNPVTTAVAVDTSGVLFGKKVVSLIAGTNNSFALCSDGILASWGDNTSGELGNGSSVTESHVPVLVDTAPLAAAGARFTSLASGPDAFHETAMVALPPAPKLIVLNGSGNGGTLRPNNSAFSFSDTSVGSSSPQTFTIENAGSADLTGLAVAQTGAGNPGDFVLNSAGLPGTLVAGASATFTVTFSPTALGVRTAVVQIASNDANANPYTFQVSGSDPSSDASLSSLVPDSGTLAPAFDRATTSYVATLAGGTTNLSLTPTVTQAGSTVTINGSPVASGSASSPVHLHGGANTLTIIVTGADGITTKTYLVGVTLDAPNIVVEQPAGTPLTFGSANADIGTAAPGTSASTVFTIRNAGTQDLTGLGITIDGANAAEFTVTANPTAPLAAGNTTSFTVTFTPTTNGTGAATLHIASNDPVEPLFDISLTAHSHTVAFDHSSQTQVEGAVTVTVPVRLSSAFATAFTVPVTFAELPNQNDYTHSVSPVSFPAGKTVANVTLTLINNNVVTGDRTVTLTLGQPLATGVALGTPSVFTLTILEDDSLPMISPQPLSKIIVAGTQVTFTSGATGSPPLILQWKKNNLAVAGATTSSLTFLTTALTDAGAYTFTATNHHPTVTSSVAQLAVVDGTSAIIRANAGTSPAMTVNAAGNSLTYRWQLNGTPLSTTNTSKYVGVTTKTLTVKTVAAADDGNYTCMVTAPGGPQVSGTFTLEVPTTAPVALMPAFPDSVVYNAYSYQLPYDTSASKAPTKFVCANLPTGLTCNPLTGLISGKPTKLGSFLITVTLSNLVGPGILVQDTMVVSGFPSGAVGTYVGWMGRDSGVNGSLGGRVDLLTTTTGSFTGTLRLGAAVYALNSFMVTAPTVGAHPGVTLTVARAGMPAVLLTLDLDPGSFALGGSAQVVGGLTSASVTGWRNTWHTTVPPNPVSAQLGSHSFELEPDFGSAGLLSVPQGYGYGTLTVTTVGGTTVSGHSSDGGAVTTSAVLGPQGEVLVYQLLYANKGSLLGSLAIGSNLTHSITGALDWQKTAVSTARDYKPFGPVGVNAYGGLYAATLPVLGLPVQVLDNAQLTFGYGGLGGLTTNPDTTLHISALNAVVLPQPNPGKITSMTLTSSTTGGTFSGKFTLTDGAVVRPVSFQGQLVSPLGKGYGYFLLPQLADPLAVPPTTSANSPILSGKVELGPVRGRST